MTERPDRSWAARNRVSSRAKRRTPGCSGLSARNSASSEKCSLETNEGHISAAGSRHFAASTRPAQAMPSYAITSGRSVAQAFSSTSSVALASRRKSMGEMARPSSVSASSTGLR